MSILSGNAERRGLQWLHSFQSTALLLSVMITSPLLSLTWDKGYWGSGGGGAGSLYWIDLPHWWGVNRPQCKLEIPDNTTHTHIFTTTNNKEKKAKHCPPILHAQDIFTVCNLHQLNYLSPFFHTLVSLSFTFLSSNFFLPLTAHPTPSHRPIVSTDHIQPGYCALQ